jgi:hypothetical protein
MRGGPLIVLATLLIGASSARAQRVTLTITGGATSTFPNPTVTNYVNGYVDNPTTIAFSLTMDNFGGNPKTATSTVEICAVNANLTNGKTLADLTWRPSDLSKPYTAILQGCTGAVNATRTVTAQQLQKSGTYAGGVLLRMNLNWASDNAASYGTPIQFRVTVVQP